MALVELPSGEWIDARTVRGVRPMIGDNRGPRVLVDVTTVALIISVEFDTPEAARVWTRDFAGKINATLTISKTEGLA